MNRGGGFSLVEQYSGDDIFSYFKEYDHDKVLGNYEDGDGTKYRGGGAIQITGRSAYQAFSDYMCDSDIIDLGALYVAKNYFWESAGYFWSIYKPSTANDDSFNLNKKCDEGESTTVITKIINGGEKGLDERTEIYDLYKQIIY